MPPRNGLGEPQGRAGGLLQNWGLRDMSGATSSPKCQESPLKKRQNQSQTGGGVGGGPVLRASWARSKGYRCSSGPQVPMGATLKLEQAPSTTGYGPTSKRGKEGGSNHALDAQGCPHCGPVVWKSPVWLEQRARRARKKGVGAFLLFWHP